MTSGSDSTANSAAASSARNWRSTRRAVVKVGAGMSLFARLLLAHRVVEAVGPAGFDELFGADHAQVAVADVARHRAACGDDRVAADADGRDQRAVAADEGVLADHRLIFE